MIKYLSAGLVLILAVMLQLWFAPAGIRGDFAIATLIVFSFLFEFWELVIFILRGVLFLNSSPYPDIAMVMLALIPLIIYFLRRRFPLDPWVGAGAGIVLGTIVFYAVTAPSAAFHAVGPLSIDILACVLFGELMLAGMEV